CKTNALPKDIIAQYLQGSENLCLYSLVVGALTGSPTLSSEVAKQSTIHNKVAEQLTNYTELLEFSKSSSEEEDYASDAKNTQPLMPFNFQHWMTLLYFEQIVSQYILMIPHELEITYYNDPLFSVHSFTNAFNTNLIEAIIPGSVLCIDESMNSWLESFSDGLTNIVIQLEPCEDKLWVGSRQTIVGNSWFGSPKLCILLIENGLYSIFHIKKRHAWPINYPDDMVEKLNTSLQDRKPQYIIATSSTT
ncbi:43081_t:CDS:2, partial [Gigaspora margarita]